MINKNTSEYSLFVEKIDLSVNELEKIVELTTDEQNRYAKLKNEKRKIEWLGTRYLVQHFYNKNSSIIYNDEGKPSLSTGEQISISHSYGVVGVFISNKQYIGLDIEQKREKIDRIKHKFLSKSELEFVENSSNKIETLTSFWSCKEALLKMYGKTDLIFEEELAVDLSEDKIIGEIKTSDFYLKAELNINIIDEFVVIWGVE